MDLVLSEATALGLQRLVGEMPLQVQIEPQPPLRAVLMQRHSEILEILPHVSIVICGENQFLKKEVPRFCRISDRVKVKYVPIGSWIDVCDAIHQAGLLCDILFVDSAIIIL